MSTYPRPVEDPAGADGSALRGSRGDHAAPSSAPRRRSGALTRVLTVVYAVIVTPIATGLIAFSGTGWLRYVMEQWTQVSFTDFLSRPMAAPIVLGLVVGLLLLLSVVATGIASSAGMLVVGAMGVISIVLAVVPELLFAVYRYAPVQVIDGFVYGIPLVLHTLIGGLGLALAMARRRPDPRVAAAAAGIVVVPLVLLTGMVLMLGGLALGIAESARTFSTEVVPAAVVLVLAGALLVWLGAAASRWSPYSLVIPALLLLAASLAMLSPLTTSMASGLWDSRTGLAMMTFLHVGGGFAAVLVMLFHVVVLALVRRRARRRLRAPLA